MSGRCKPAVVVTRPRASMTAGGWCKPAVVVVRPRASMTATLKRASVWTPGGEDAVMPVVRKNPSAARRLAEAEARALHEKISGMAIELVPIDSIKPNPRNAKEHSEYQIALLAENMREFGVTQPILIDETNTILAGHARLAAERRIGLKEVPVIRLTDLSPQQKRVVALADNKLPELGRWNEETLRLELKELTVDTGDLTFDYSLTGFDTVEIDEILGDDAAVARPDPADQMLPLVESEAVVTEVGDLWVCGDHRLYCGSALEASSYRAVLDGAPADLVFADPLYSVPVADHAARRGAGRELLTPAGDPTSEEFIEFLQTIAVNIAGNVSPGAVIYFCMNWWRLEELAAAMRQYFRAPKDMVIWNKSDAGRGAFYGSQHEHIAVYVAGGTAPATNVRLGDHRSNVWSYRGAKTTDRNWLTGARFSATLKPVALLVDALRDCSKRGQIVLDPCAGVGTMMIAAERTGRRARLIEIDPAYCDRIVRRWQTFTGKTAQLAESQQTFAELEARRIGASGSRE
jgi:DNA modification methylase